MRYLWAAFKVAFLAHGYFWWYSVILAYALGIGFFGDYPIARAKVNGWLGPILPEHVPWWLVIGPFVAWVLAHLGHVPINGIHESAAL